MAHALGFRRGAPAAPLSFCSFFSLLLIPTSDFIVDVDYDELSPCDHAFTPPFPLAALGKILPDQVPLL